ncbi:MAG: RNA 2',3'-cyclic phosphodiesterase [Thermoplasmata archaeon]
MRAFIAVDIEATRGIVRLLDALRHTPARVRVVSPENLHITLKFLGETDDGLVPSIRDALAAAAAGEAPFSLALRGSGAFPNPARPRVLWIGTEGGDTLVRIAKRLERALQELGFARERRPFTPHLTVGRVKGSKDVGELTELLVARRDETYATQRVETVRLKRSELGPTGAVYHDVFRVPLG